MIVGTKLYLKWFCILGVYPHKLGGFYCGNGNKLMWRILQFLHQNLSIQSVTFQWCQAWKHWVLRIFFLSYKTPSGKHMLRGEATFDTYIWHYMRTYTNREDSVFPIGQRRTRESKCSKLFKLKTDGDMIWNDSLVSKSGNCTRSGKAKRKKNKKGCCKLNS